MSRHSSDKVPLTDADLDRFHKNAPAAAGRRTWGFMLDEMFTGLQLLLFGAVPIYGILFWDWPAHEMLLFLLIGTWVGILTATTRFAFLKKEAIAYASARYDDWHVWVVADALRKKEKEAYAAHLGAKWNPYGGIFVDYVMGGISTILVVIMLSSAGILKFDSEHSRSIGLWLVVLVVTRVTTTLYEVISFRRKGPGESIDKSKLPPVKVVVGLRGVGLFLLVFLTAMVTDQVETGVNAPWLLMIVVNASICLLGIIGLMTPLLLLGETRWLRRYLRENSALEKEK